MVKTLQYLKNYMMTSHIFDEKQFYPILERLKKNLCACNVGLVPFSARTNTENKEICPWCLFSFTFAERDIAVLREVEFGKKTDNYEIKDHYAAEVARKFCRDTAAKIIVSLLPSFPIFAFDFLTIYFHYDSCLPDTEHTVRIYAVSVYMDNIRSVNMSELNEENIKKYFEFENSQLDFLFYRWKERGVLMSENQELA
jgi:hypothetical protein